jgi:thiosulfate/3-mercaptopyruvate sulfurtransferase
MAEKIRRWRGFFYGKVPTSINSPAPSATDLPAVVDTDWLAQNLGRSDLVVLDLRAQPDYSTAHIPGSRRLDVESLRGNINGIGSLLLPVDLLARHFGLLGINRTDEVILLPGVKFHDAALASMAFTRLGHPSYAILNGGFEKWLAEDRPWDQLLPVVTPTSYPTDVETDHFTVDAQAVLQVVRRRDAMVIDVRPAEYHQGEKSDEARAGRIPGAVSRPYTEDVVESDAGTTFKPAADLSHAYSALIPSKSRKVVVHCRTGHQASQTFYVLTRLLNYDNVYWYDAGWTEWAARLDLPIETTIRSP